MIEVKEGWELLKSEPANNRKCASCGKVGSHACKPAPTQEDKNQLRRSFGQEEV